MLPLRFAAVRAIPQGAKPAPGAHSNFYLGRRSEIKQAPLRGATEKPPATKTSRRRTKASVALSRQFRLHASFNILRDLIN